MEWLTTAVTALTGVVTSVIGIISDTPILGLCFAGTCVFPIGIKVFKKLRA